MFCNRSRRFAPLLTILLLLLCVNRSFGLSEAELTAEVDEDENEFLNGTFPEGFLWGLATSAYQIEGAWNISWKGENIWDAWSHENNGGNIEDNSNGDIACDSYHKYDADIQALKSMKANFYRFSLSWSRIIPTGRISDGINQAGIDYYNNLINGLLSANIEPFVTIYHWDLPIGLFSNGGWLNDTINQHFADFAKLAYENFGDRVKKWVTFNEPLVFCTAHWNYGYHDGFKQPPEEPYICAHNVVKSHALAYRIYQREFKEKQGGMVGITLNCDWPQPKNTSDIEHVAASNRAMYFRYGWWAHPITTGEYPLVMRRLLDSKSECEGRNESRLPTFDSNWTSIINGSTDFLGLNHYSSAYVLPTNGSNLWLEGDANVKYERDSTWNSSGMGWAIYPPGLRRVITWISREYKLPIYMTENGYGGSRDEGLDDIGRVSYYRSYINEVLKSIVLDGSDVRSYTAWSLMDNYEWTHGYNARFGVHYINFSDPSLPRIPKQSAIELTKIFVENGFPTKK